MKNRKNLKKEYTFNNRSLKKYCEQEKITKGFCKLADKNIKNQKIKDIRLVKNIVQFLKQLPEKINLRVDIALILFRAFTKLPKSIFDKNKDKILFKYFSKIKLSDIYTTLKKSKKFYKQYIDKQNDNNKKIDDDTFIKGSYGTKMKLFKDFNKYGQPEVEDMVDSWFLVDQINIFNIINFITYITSNKYTTKLQKFIKYIYNFKEELLLNIQKVLGIGCIRTGGDSKKIIGLCNNLEKK